MNYLKPELLILVPLLIGLGRIVKQKMGDAKWVPLILLATSVLIATVYGFIVTTRTGWRMALDAVVITGLCHGAVAAFSAMGLYDTAKSARKE